MSRPFWDVAQSGEDGKTETMLISALQGHLVSVRALLLPRCILFIHYIHNRSIVSLCRPLYSLVLDWCLYPLAVLLAP
jgi:hypothetical protein